MTTMTDQERLKKAWEAYEQLQPVPAAPATPWYLSKENKLRPSQLQTLRTARTLAEANNDGLRFSMSPNVCRSLERRGYVRRENNPNRAVWSLTGKGYSVSCMVLAAVGIAKFARGLAR